MTMPTTIEEQQTPGSSPCWCCGMIEDPARLLHLSNHREVVVCTRCAHSLSKWAREIEDQARTGPAVRARTCFRRLRKTVVSRGWITTGSVGRGLRWIGRFTP